MVIVDVEPGRPAKVRSVPLSAGRRLVRATGTWHDLVARDDLREAYLDLTVETAGPDTQLAERVREEFDFVVKVRAEYPRPETDAHDREARTLEELYAAYHLGEVGVRPDAELMAAFRSVMEEAGYAAP